MSRDLIAELGYLCLGSRFRRLGERLQMGVSELAQSEGIAVQPAQFPLLAALADDPLSIGELAQRLDLSQPGVTRTIGQLVSEGLVELVTADAGSRHDQRRRVFQLSAQGRALLERAEKRVFPLVEATVQALCSGPPSDLLGHLDHLDTALAEAAFGKRLLALREREDAQ